VPSYLVEPLESLATELTVVLASRTCDWEVLTNTYGFPGSETELLSRGLMLDGPKARLFLSLLLGSGASQEGVTGASEHWFGG